VYSQFDIFQMFIHLYNEAQINMLHLHSIQVID
jgi:hypothetical protein